METVTIKLCFVSKGDVTTQVVTGIEPAAKFQPLSKITRSEKHSVQVVWVHIFYIVFSTLPFGKLGRLAILRVLAGHNAPPCKQRVLANRHVD